MTFISFLGVLAILSLFFSFKLWLNGLSLAENVPSKQEGT